MSKNRKFTQKQLQAKATNRALRRWTGMTTQLSFLKRAVPELNDTEQGTFILYRKYGL